MLLAFYFVQSLKVKMVGTLNGEQEDAKINLDLSSPLALQIKRRKRGSFSKSWKFTVVRSVWLI